MALGPHIRLGRKDLLGRNALTYVAAGVGDEENFFIQIDTRDKIHNASFSFVTYEWARQTSVALHYDGKASQAQTLKLIRPIHPLWRK